ncbi:hypothetical protein CMI47_18115 [Candidatus Pacearchaeota archaeon]|nr:hypothetical protein [Candidatus Pacearchaeota archaeon]
MSFINDLELEASCRIAEAGGMLAGNGAGFRYVSYWLGGLHHLLPPARDGVARSGKVDRLGRPLQQGRGQGMMDEIIPVVIPALAGHPFPAIVEMVPVALKGSKGKGYGNRDLTLYHEIPFAMAADGIPFWVILLRGTADAMEMRRIDASGVILAQQADGLPADTVKIRDDKRKYEKADGTIKVYDYTRLRIEWARVAKHRPDLFLDADWREFDPTLPLPIHYL